MFIDDSARNNLKIQPLHFAMFSYFLAFVKSQAVAINFYHLLDSVNLISIYVIDMFLNMLFWCDLANKYLEPNV